MTEFRDFLKPTGTVIEEEMINSEEIANGLTRTLGRKLAGKGWSVGSKGSGIVAMADNEDGKRVEAISAVHTFLKNVKVPGKLKKGKLAGAVSVPYKNALLSVVDAGKTIKITVS